MDVASVLLLRYYYLGSTLLDKPSDFLRMLPFTISSFVCIVPNEIKYFEEQNKSNEIKYSTVFRTAPRLKLNRECVTIIGIYTLTHDPVVPFA